MRLQTSVYKKSVKIIDPDAAYTVKQTAKFLGVSEVTVYRYRTKKNRGVFAPRPRENSTLYLGSDLIKWMTEVIEANDKGGISDKITRAIESAPKTVRITGKLVLTTGKDEEILRFGDAV